MLVFQSWSWKGRSGQTKVSRGRICLVKSHSSPGSAQKIALQHHTHTALSSHSLLPSDFGHSSRAGDSRGLERTQSSHTQLPTDRQSRWHRPRTLNVGCRRAPMRSSEGVCKGQLGRRSPARAVCQHWLGTTRE